MGGRIPAEAIQHIRERASLIEVVSDVVTLRKRGRTVVGLCPFHAEKSPSFGIQLGPGVCVGWPGIFTG